jgi:hypothetical protein
MEIIWNSEDPDAFRFYRQRWLCDHPLQPTDAFLIAAPMCLVRDEQHTIMEMVVEPTDDMFLALSLEQMSPGHLFKAPRQRSLSGAFLSDQHQRHLGLLRGGLYRPSKPPDDRQPTL